MTELRPIRAEEWPEALGLWEEVFGVGQWLFDSLHQSTAGRDWGHVRVAVEEGRIVSAADVFLRYARDEDGTPLLIGGIGSVATRPEARRRGLSRELLRQLIEVMEEAGCAWSMLFTGTFDHYAPLGWKRVAIHAEMADLRHGTIDAPMEVRSLGPLWPLAAMAELYDAFNGTRPLTGIRTDLIWNIAIKIRLERPDRLSLGCWRDGKLCGYLTATTGKDKSWLEEISVMPGDAAAIVALLRGYALELRSLGLSQVEIQLPRDPVFEEPLNSVFENRVVEPNAWTMARSISSSFGDDRVRALFENPLGTYYGLDKF